MGRRANDLEFYERHAEGWWDEDDSSFRSLRSVKAFHLALLLEHWERGPEGAQVVDLGCGGGLFALPLAERGAEVFGLDRSHGSLRAGSAEAARRGTQAHFVHGDVRSAPLADGWADLVLLSDVVEHVERPADAIREAARLLRPGGLLFVNTFDRSRLAGLVIVTLAEGIGLVPRGTHDPRLFVKPEELDAWARSAGLTRMLFAWERPALFATVRSWTVQMRRAKRGFAYTMLYTKPECVQ